MVASILKQLSKIVVLIDINFDLDKQQLQIPFCQELEVLRGY